MAVHKPGRFLFLSVVSGLAAAVLVLYLDTRLHPQQEQLHTVEMAPQPGLTRTSGPVSYADAVQQAGPAVVNIFTTKIVQQRVSPLFDDPFFRQFFRDLPGTRVRKRRQNSLGSGVIVDSRGYVVTNNHVIAEADEIRVVLGNGTTLEAQVVGTDPDTDIALLKVKNGGALPVVALGSSSGLRVGDVVFAIGNPFGVGQTVTMGIVSATGRNQLGITNFENFIQTDAAINPGNSGGALIDANGGLVGINTAIFSKSGGYQGIGFAIPVDMVSDIMSQLVSHGEVRRGWLGIAGQDVTPELADSFGLKETRGVLISSVLDDGPADLSGMRPGDVITRIDSEEIDSAFDVVNAVAGKPPGTEVRILGWRGSDPLDLIARLQARPPRE
ncbi:MAG: Do family serine endopeptidase [Pseudomonadota bacterium]